MSNLVEAARQDWMFTAMEDRDSAVAFYRFHRYVSSNTFVFKTWQPSWQARLHHFGEVARQDGWQPKGFQALYC